MQNLTLQKTLEIEKSTRRSYLIRTDISGRFYRIKTTSARILKKMPDNKLGKIGYQFAP